MHEKFLTLFVFIAGSLRLSKRPAPENVERPLGTYRSRHYW